MTAVFGPTVLPWLLIGYMLATLTYSYVLKDKLFANVKG